MRTPLPASLALLLVLPGCATEYPNPFVSDRQSTAPSAAAAILYTSNSWSAAPNAGREVFAVERTGANVTRLTTCGASSAGCDNLEAIAAPDRRRVVVRRVATNASAIPPGAETNVALLMVDLARGVEGGLVPASANVSGFDFYPGQEFLFYSATGQGTEDLYQIGTNAQGNQNLTGTTTVRERRPRFDAGATAVTYETSRGPGTLSTLALTDGLGTRSVTTGVPGGTALVAPYLVGSDADPSFSPDGNRLVFRRLVAAGNGDRGIWDVMTVGLDGTGPTTVATGPAYRGAPDWGSDGILFAESVSGGSTQLVLVNPDGTNRRALVTVGAGFTISAPHWLP